MMKRVSQMALVLAVTVMPALAGADASFLAPYERASLPAINPPKAIVEVLPNGMRCYLLEDHTIPVAHVRVITKVGTIYDPADKAGLASITAILMRSGGAGELGPAQFDAALDGYGAVLSSDMGSEMGTATLESLSGDLDNTLPLLFEMIFKPRLDETRLDVAKLNVQEALRRADDDPEELAAYKYRQLVYGRQSPWARRPDGDSLSRIKVDDVRAFHDKYFKAGDMILAAAGDFNSREIVTLLRRLTADAPKGEVSFPEVPAVDLKFRAAEERIARPTTQAFVRMGQLSIKRNNPDKFALFLVNEILGGGAFKSRLMQDIRTKRGMVYSIWSSVSPGLDYGLFTVGLATKADQADKVMELVRGHIEKIIKPGDIEQSELVYAKQSILSGLIFDFDRAFKVVDGRARFYFYGYPDDYWKIYRDRIVSAKLSELSRVAAKYLHPDALDSLVVGPEASGGGKEQKKDDNGGKGKTSGRSGR